MTRPILSVESASGAPLLARILAFSSIVQPRQVKLREALFAGLREKALQYDDEEYKTSLPTAHRHGELKSIGDVDYSCSMRGTPVFAAQAVVYRVPLGLHCDPG